MSLPPIMFGQVNDADPGFGTLQVAGHIRVAFEVEDTARVTDSLADAGADVVAPPTHTPWNSFNARLSAPADLQVTIFAELDQP